MKTKILPLIALWIGLASSTFAASLMEPTGVPDRFVGASNAPSTLIVYSAPTCGHCIRFEEQVLPLLKSRYVDSGRLRVSVRSIMNTAVDGVILLLADAGGVMRRDATLAHFRSKHAEIVAAKDKQKVLRKIAAQAGLDSAAFDRALKNSDRLQALQRLSNQAGKDFGVAGTPTFFLDGVEIKYDGTITSFSRYLDKPPRS